jgi:hypothetical protein
VRHSPKQKGVDDTMKLTKERGKQRWWLQMRRPVVDKTTREPRWVMCGPWRGEGRREEKTRRRGHGRRFMAGWHWGEAMVGRGGGGGW